MSWTRQQVQLLITEYKQHPILYSAKNKYYRNKKLRTVALNEILKKLKPLRPETQLIDIIKKMNGLRTHYNSERRKQLRGLDITDDTAEIYQPSLWYFDLMGFLDEHICSRERHDDPKRAKIETKTEIEVEEGLLHDNTSGYQSISDPLSENETESKISFDFPNFPVDKPGRLVEQGRNLDYSTDPDDNGWLHYLSTLLSQIKDPQSRVLLRHKITKLMYEEIEKQFTEQL